MDAMRETLGRVIRKHPEIRLAYLFGSAARGEAGPTSDVDVAVYVDRGHPMDLLDLQLALQDEIGRALGTNRTEVVILDPAGPPEFTYQVIRDGIVLHEEEPYRVLLEPRILNAYFDFRDSLRRHGLTAA